jgi:hypothetical protein
MGIDKLSPDEGELIGQEEVFRAGGRCKPID